jgi:hypothetical protein
LWISKSFARTDAISTCDALSGTISVSYREKNGLAEH